MLFAMKTYSEEEASDLIIQAFKNGKVQGRKELTDITHRNYEATKRRGLITSETTRTDFWLKLIEEMNEFGQSDLKDEKELADIALVCFAMAEHYGIDLIEEMRKKTEFNETRP